jgi:glycosyltransferase involved in cell wall biosynthesis
VRVLHYVSRLDDRLGGVVTAVEGLVEALADAGHEVILATGEAPNDDSAAPARSPQVRLVELKGRLGPGDWLSRREVAEALALARQCDVVHLHTAWDLGNYRLAARLRRAEIPYVTSVHGMLDEWSMSQKRLKKQLVLATMGRRFFAGAAIVHCTAEGEMQQAQLALRIAPDRFSVCPFLMPAWGGGETSAELACRTWPALGNGAPTLLFLSRLHYKKGLELLLDAAGVLAESGRDFQLAIAGPGDEPYVETLRARAVQRGVADRAHFLGMVRGELKESLYRLADVFVLPTQQENLGIVLLEALRAGTSVVTTKGTDIWPELEQAGAVIVERDVKSLAGAIARLLDDAEDRQRRGQSGQQFVARWLDRGRIVEQFVAMYERARRGRR